MSNTDTRLQHLAWSKLSLSPIPFEYNGIDLVAWDGMLMTNKHALLVSAYFMLGISPTPEMNRKASQEALSHIRNGVFDCVLKPSTRERLCSSSTTPSSSLTNYYKDELQHTIPTMEKKDKHELFNMLQIKTIKENA